MRGRDVRRGTVAALVVALIAMSGVPAVRAEDPGAAVANPQIPSGAVLQSGAMGAIDWSQGMITAFGEGAVAEDAKAPGPARLGAIRAAKVDAMRNILEMVKQVRISSETTVENAMVSSDVIRTRVEGILQGATQIGEPVYLSDVTVRVTVGVPLNQAFSDAVLPNAGFSVDAPAKFPTPPVASGVVTGLIVDARGLAARPAMAPRILDPAGAELYGTSQVNREYAVEQGMAGYARSLEGARADARIGESPMVVKAVKVHGAAKTDIEIADADAKKIRDAATTLSFLQQCRVMIVVD